MSIEYCDYCDSNIDLDFDVEHWSEDEYAKGRDHRKCKWELEDDLMFHTDRRIKQCKTNYRTSQPDPLRPERDVGK